MTPTRSRLPAPRRTIDRRIVGDREYVTAAIRRLQADRRLVHATPWMETPEGVQVTVRILAPTAPPPTPPARRRRWLPIAAVTAVGGTTLSVAAYALIQLVDAVIAALPAIGAGLLLLALVALLTRTRTRAGTFTGTFTGRMD